MKGAHNLGWKNVENTPNASIT